ncbi:hypothetical protein KO525_05075 [Psychrosphaera sp. B3R10]|uniref:hypothetical protein n=1 Tax=unclassified Psychrosphaera TaxID=2641570 RepID=UPI001C099619|nr:MULTISPECIES: hypothetical protein [unclassified Psychrosphaera]MBU2883885.1 hypothetical protein [Psychrosphaera sp. I2R16]MBU2988748.1 hypothetical protein [Psychrosphaera sp. B3R10]
MKKLILVTFMFIISACTSVQYTNQPVDQAYVQLEGNFIGATIILGQTITNIDAKTKTFELNGKTVAKFPIAIGSHELKVLRNGKLVINKNIFVTQGQTVDVIIP